MKLHTYPGSLGKIIFYIPNGLGACQPSRIVIVMAVAGRDLASAAMTWSAGVAGWT